MTIQHEEINIPEVISELAELYPRYEQALISNDVETLIAMFWASPEVMRFGVSENLYGHDELEAFRKARPSANLARSVKRLEIVSFGRDYASITLEFERNRPADKSSNQPGEPIRGRQSQVWVRFPLGWRIVSAHVSLLANI